MLADATFEGILFHRNGLITDVNAALCRLLGQKFPGVHVVQGDAYNLKDTLAGVLKEPAAAFVSGLPLFNNALATQYARKMSLITGALPAQYGFRTAGVVDIALKSGTTDLGVQIA